MLKAAIFDLDGVIVNTVPLHFKSWQRMFSEYGKEFTFEDYKEKVDGIPRIDGARAILSDLSREELIKAGETKQRYFLEALKKDDIMVYETTVNLIHTLRGDHIKTAIISSSKNCPAILEKAGLAGVFDSAVTGGDVSKGKPDPEIFLTAAKKLYVSPAESIVFEDAVLGVEAAKRANMRCVGIDRYNKPDRLNKADIVVSDLDEIDLKKIKALF